jgi:hypothetical protein
VNVHALQDRALELVLRSRPTQRLALALFSGMAAGFCLGQLIHGQDAHIAVASAVLAGVAYRFTR